MTDGAVRRLGWVPPIADDAFLSDCETTTRPAAAEYVPPIGMTPHPASCDPPCAE
jgi:hypothetical protein